METMAFLGCSRGLGLAVVQEFLNTKHWCPNNLLVSRKTESLLELLTDKETKGDLLSLDFSKPGSVDETLQWIAKKKICRVFYFAGGGPYGFYQQKQWKDHQWSLQVNFLTPAQLLHGLCHPSFDFVKQVIFVGSKIADSTGDPKAASYAAGKHGLKGLIDSILLEGTEKDIRLFRPGYMDTALLPKNAAPRAHQPVTDPTEAAKAFHLWVMDPGGEKLKNL